MISSSASLASLEDRASCTLPLTMLQLKYLLMTLDCNGHQKQQQWANVRLRHDDEEETTGSSLNQIGGNSLQESGSSSYSGFCEEGEKEQQRSKAQRKLHPLCWIRNGVRSTLSGLALTAGGTGEDENGEECDDDDCCPPQHDSGINGKEQCDADPFLSATNRRYYQSEILPLFGAGPSSSTASSGRNLRRSILPRLVLHDLFDLFLKSTLVVLTSSDALATLHPGDSESLEIFHAIDSPGEFVGIDAHRKHVAVCRALGFTEFKHCPVQPLQSYDGVHASSVTCIAVAPSGVVATGGCDATVALWNETRGDDPTFMLLAGHSDWVRFLSFCSDRHGHLLLLSGGDDGQVILWDGVSGALLSRSSRNESAVRALSCTWDGSLVALAFDSPRIDLLTANGRSLVPAWPTQRKEREKGAHDKKRNKCEISHADDRGEGSKLHDSFIETNNTLVTALSLYKNGRYLAFAGENENITIVRLKPIPATAETLAERRLFSDGGSSDDDEDSAAWPGRGTVVAVCSAHAVQRMCTSFMTTISSVRILTAPPETSYFTVLSVSSEGEFVTWTVPARVLAFSMRRRKSRSGFNGIPFLVSGHATSECSSLLNFCYHSLLKQLQQRANDEDAEEEDATSDDADQEEEEEGDYLLIEQTHRQLQSQHRSASLIAPPSPSSPSYRSNETAAKKHTRQHHQQQLEMSSSLSSSQLVDVEHQRADDLKKETKQQRRSATVQIGYDTVGHVHKRQVAIGPLAGAAVLLL